MSYCIIFYMLKSLSDLIIVTRCPFKYNFLFSSCILILIVPVINLETLYRLIHLFKFNFPKIFKWDITWIGWDKYVRSYKFLLIQLSSVHTYWAPCSVALYIMLFLLLNHHMK